MIIRLICHAGNDVKMHMPMFRVPNKLEILFVTIPVDRVIEDVRSNAFVISIITNDMFVIISLPNIAKIYFYFCLTGDGRFERPDNRPQ
jgi:hypothetical protein